MTVAVFTFVMLIGNVLRQVLDLIVSGQVSIGLVMEAVLLLIPFAWSYALPMGMLTAALLVFGRFSADHELTAVRAGGISLVSLVAPVLILSLGLCAISAWVNLEISPRCRLAHKNILARAKDRMLDPKGGVSVAAFLPEGRFIKDYTGYIIHVRKNTGGKLEDVSILRLADKTNVTSVLAPRGEIRLDAAAKQLRLKLYDAQIIQFSDKNLGLTDGDYEAVIDLSTPTKTGGKPDMGNMTFSELRSELGEIEGRFGAAPPTNMPPAQLRELMKQVRKQRDDFTTPLRVQIHAKLAASFACFGFTLLGIPLGIRVHRRETNVGFAIALVLVVVYYGLLTVGLNLDSRPEFAPHLIVWLPNFIFQAVGGVLLWRANKGI